MRCTTTSCATAKARGRAELSWSCETKSPASTLGRCVAGSPPHADEPLTDQKREEIVQFLYDFLREVMRYSEVEINRSP
jgi:hypothetical protein